MITATEGKLHWNYFIALEQDLEVVARYIEFSERNFDTYSIELAHLLFAAASEVDVVAKLVCERVSPHAPRGNINDYRVVLLAEFPDISSKHIFVPRYGLTLTPWENWTGLNNPDWWRSYNNVKHERDAHFHEATLKNALNALGALLIVTFIHYSYSLATGGAPRLDPRNTTEQLRPDSTLLRLPADHYSLYLLINV